MIGQWRDLIGKYLLSRVSRVYRPRMKQSLVLMTSYGSTSFHIIGVTPEASTIKDVDGETLPVIEVEDSELKALRKSFGNKEIVQTLLFQHLNSILEMGDVQGSYRDKTKNTHDCLYYWHTMTCDEWGSLKRLSWQENCFGRYLLLQPIRARDR